LNTWDEDKRKNSNHAHDRDNKTRVPDGKSQQVSQQKHRPDLYPKTP